MNPKDRFFLDITVLLFMLFIPLILVGDFNFWIYLPFAMAYIIIGHWFFFHDLYKSFKRLIKKDKEPFSVNCPYCGQLINIDSQNLKKFGDDYHWYPVCISCLTKTKKVSTYPASYQGKIPIDKNYAIHEVESLYFGNKENALDELKLRAIKEGYNAIYDVIYIQNHDTKGNYVFSIWRASGKAFIKKET